LRNYTSFHTNNRGAKKLKTISALVLPIDAEELLRELLDVVKQKIFF